ncbi:hypothetical protein TcWFU_004494 [Taenia crassiceps]|uniref:DNA polymerase delta subunit 3 n=1 Tax=Taenia crassiceps TaxID=6207 RepID=A0ABR4Q701_9CEST
MESAILSSVNQHFEDHEGIASCKSLSIAFGWSLEESQKNLERYLRLHPQLHPVYCVSGFHTGPEGEWEYVVRLTTSVDDDADKDLINPTRHIYSIHRGETTSLMTLFCFDKSLGQDPTAHPVLVSFPWQPCRLPVPNAKPQKASAEPSPVKQRPSTLSSAVTTTTSVAASARTAAPSSKKRSTKRQARSRMQSYIKIEGKSSEPHKAPVDSEHIPDPFADSEEDEIYANEKFHTKRRRIVFFSDEEEAERAVEMGLKPAGETLRNDSKSPPASTSRPLRRHNKSPQNLKVVKATLKGIGRGRKRSGGKKGDESWEEDDNGEEEEPFKLSPAEGVKLDYSSAANPPRNSFRRQVTKTYLDDDGFLVTEKVWENVKANGDAEQAEPSVPSASKPEAGLSPTKPRVASGSKKAKQATLTSFFKK